MRREFLKNGMGATQQVVNAMTVDIEDYFQVAAFEECIPRVEWGQWPQRVERNTELVLEMLEQHDVKGTFFILGWIAERYPELVRRIAACGHEVASHGFGHERLSTLSPTRFRENVVRAKVLLEEIANTEVIGYRAPSYSIGSTTLWAYEELQRAGYRYSSSVVPMRHDLYGLPAAPRFPFFPEGTGVVELPITTLEILGRNWPCGGGGYFRLFPYPYFRWGMRYVNTREQNPCVFYFHPWEIDTEQPRVPGVKLRNRVRHYLNLGAMRRKLDALLQDFRFDRMDRIFLPDSHLSEYPVVGLGSLAN